MLQRRGTKEWAHQSLIVNHQIWKRGIWTGDNIFQNILTNTTCSVLFGLRLLHNYRHSEQLLSMQTHGERDGGYIAKLNIRNSFRPSCFIISDQLDLLDLKRINWYMDKRIIIHAIQARCLAQLSQNGSSWIQLLIPTFPTDEKNSSRSRALILAANCIQKTVLASRSSGVKTGERSLLQKIRRYKLIQFMRLINICTKTRTTIVWMRARRVATFRVATFQVILKHLSIPW